MKLEFLLYSLLFVLIGLLLVSFFLIWKWFDAHDRLKVVRETTREQTLHAIRHAHNKCRILLYVELVLAIGFIQIPLMLQDYYTMLVYPAVVIVADILLLFGLRSRANSYKASIDEYVNANEEHVTPMRSTCVRQLQPVSNNASSGDARLRCLIRRLRQLSKRP